MPNKTLHRGGGWHRFAGQWVDGVHRDGGERDRQRGYRQAWMKQQSWGSEHGPQIHTPPQADAHPCSPRSGVVALSCSPGLISPMKAVTLPGPSSSVFGSALPPPSLLALSWATPTFSSLQDCRDVPHLYPALRSSSC